LVPKLGMICLSLLCHPSNSEAKLRSSTCSMT